MVFRWLRALGPTQQQALPPGPCSIVDLLQGPLHLGLLGLVVDLNQIHLRITADPNGGILGSLLCSITKPASNNHVKGGNRKVLEEAPPVRGAKARPFCCRVLATANSGHQRP